MTGRQTRAERAAYPLARDSIRKIAEASGGCLRPVQLRRTDTATGETVSVMVAVRGDAGQHLPAVCGAGEDAAGGSVLGGLAPRERAGTKPGRAR